MKSNTKKSSPKIKKYANGDFVSTLNKNVDGISSGFNLLSGLIQQGNNPWKVNTGSMIGSGALSGAATGSQIGSVFGPEGTLIGGGIGALAGGIGGIFGANNKLKQLGEYNTNGMINSNRLFENSLNRINTNQLGTQLYANGGNVDPKPPKKVGNTLTDLNNGVGVQINPNGNIDLGYSRVYGSQYNIPNNNIEALRTLYAKDPSVLKILDRNIAPNGQVRMYGADDGDAIRQLLGQYQQSHTIAPNGLPQFKDGGDIHIKKSHEGRFTAYKKRTGKTTEEALHSSDPHVRQMANFARNAAKWKHADGDEVQNNIINIEKGELQIDPSSGKVLRTYKGVNPQTGGLYEDHAKRQSNESINNLVTAEPGTFIVTKSKSKDYQDSIDRNDKIRQNTILMNIRNAKQAKESASNKQFKYGSYVPSFGTGGVYTPVTNPIDYNNLLSSLVPSSTQPLQINNPLNSDLNPDFGGRTLPSISPQNNVYSNSIPKPNLLTTLQNDQAQTPLDKISAYGPAAINIAQGLFGKLDTLPRATFNANPYKSQILSNLPKDINTDSIINDQLGQANAANTDLLNNVNNSSVYRANRQQLGSNINRALANTRLQGQIQNNDVARQRAGIYGELGQQDVAEMNRVRDLNRQSDESAIQARAAKNNILNTGISQFQQATQSQKYNKVLQDQDLYKLSLLKDLNPFAKYYTNLGGSDQKFKMGGTVFSTKKSKLKK